MTNIRTDRLFDNVFNGAYYLKDSYAAAIQDIYPHGDVIKDRVFVEGEYPSTDNIIEKLSLLFDTKHVRPSPKAALPIRETTIAIEGPNSVKWGSKFTIDDGSTETFCTAQFLELDISELRAEKQSIPNLKEHFALPNRRRIYYTLYEGSMPSSGFTKSADIAIVLTLDFTTVLGGSVANRPTRAKFALAEYAGFKAAKSISLKYKTDTKNIKYTSNDNFIAFSHWSPEQINYFDKHFCNSNTIDRYDISTADENWDDVSIFSNDPDLFHASSGRNVEAIDRYEHLVRRVSKKIKSYGQDMPKHHMSKSSSIISGSCPLSYMEKFTIAVPIPERKSRTPTSNEFAASAGRRLKGIEFELSKKEEMFYEYLSDYNLRIVSTLSILDKASATLTPRLQQTFNLPIFIGDGKYTGGDIVGTRLISVNHRTDEVLTSVLMKTNTFDIVDNYWHTDSTYKLDSVVDFKSGSYGMYVSSINFRTRREFYTKSLFEPYAWWRGGGIIGMLDYKTDVRLTPMPIVTPLIDYAKLIKEGKDEIPFNSSVNPLETTKINSAAHNILDPLNQYCLSVDRRCTGVVFSCFSLINKADLRISNMTHLQPSTSGTLARARLFQPSLDNKFTECSTYINTTAFGNDINTAPSGLNFTSATNVVSKLEMNNLATYKLPYISDTYDVHQTLSSMNIIKSTVSSMAPIN